MDRLVGVNGSGFIGKAGFMNGSDGHAAKKPVADDHKNSHKPVKPTKVDPKMLIDL